ncbi:hypothetical protein IH992_07650 [Candidatus Poribacteria bacterium]|nr:hypothetical protein [Candidatus Poribacteria bacterium]
MAKLIESATTAELLNNPNVQQVLDSAWADSLASDPVERHEEGGWIYQNTMTRGITTQRAKSGGQASIDLSQPSIVPGSVVVATFHTHPNPTSEGWQPGPSRDDIRSAQILGVPCIIQADDGIYTAGPDSRRGGLSGSPGFPA